jgi:acetyl-CoA carboxylase biotin carboxyl carrier protein
LAELIRLVETRGLAELIVEEGEHSYRIRGTGTATGSAPEPGGSAGAPPSRGEGPDIGPPGGPQPADWVAVTSPMVGVFFRSPSPGEAPFVEVGDRVEEGQTLGLIEAMKVFSEVPAEHEGVVAEFAAQDGALVRPDEPLLYLAPVPPGSGDGEQDA